MEKWKEAIEKQEIPKVPLETAILKGFHRARDKRAKRTVRKRGLWTIVAAAVLMLTFITSIRVSPVFANAIASIPGMSVIVDMIQDNKGLQMAIENEHYQAIGVSGESKSFKVTLEGLITDENGLIIFSSAAQKNSNQIQFSSVRVLDQNGVPISKNGSYSFNYPELTHTAELEFETKIPTDELLIEYTFSKDEEEASETIQIPFKIELKPIKKEQYIINETVEVKGQKIHIRSITIGSLKTAIEVEYDAENTMKIFGFEDLRLEDEKGEVWTSIQNGVTARGSDNPNVMTYYLQSNYFRQTDHLTLKFNKLMAMDREDAFIIIDTDKKEIIRQPKDKRFRNMTVHRGGYVEFELRGEEGYHHDPFSTIIDAQGKELRMMSGYFSRKEEDRISIGFDLPDEAYTNPLKLPLAGYPSYITGNVSVEIK
ncbi:DUF4179 domain-containing protein [Sporosarcina sp. NCCP-2222]|uniref:DUF4179 domain-containing protein n=1 Tax=Sporosarcina sp. NCCP-2222 TaxID=2935073 RepID=UPI0020C1525D|nr:DUF4179 domain-containing protein [Sporosarcina sp. NCCP-2222]